MSRSYKKEPIRKEKGFSKDNYNKKFRRACKQVYIDENTLFPNSRELTNDYDICDWKIDARKWNDEDKINRFKRK